MTRNLKAYTLFALIWSILFFAFLDWCVDKPRNRWPAIVVNALVYVVGLLAGGILLKMSDSQRYAKFNLNLAYFVVSNLSCLIVAAAWIGFFKRQEWRSLILMAVVFGLVDLMAWIFSRRTIKYKEEQQLLE